MTFWVYCICWNEKELMPYFLRHYASVADRIIFYDDHSTDGTREMIAAEPKAVLRDWADPEQLADDKFMHFANEQWKEARGQADWVAWVDADEFLYHPNLRQKLEQYQVEGVTLPRISGWGMVSDGLPKGNGQIWEEIKTGFLSPEWEKQELFSPSIQMRWGVGRHNIDIIGPYRVGEPPEIKLLHYRYLGWDYLKSRSERNYSRQSERCRQNSYGDNNAPNSTKRYSLHWYRQEIMNRTFPEVI